MKNFTAFIVALMIAMPMASCCMTDMTATDDTAVVTTTTGAAYTFYWLFDNGHYYRRPCPVYYALRPYYWGGPHSYYHRGWHPSHNARVSRTPSKKPVIAPRNRTDYHPNHQTNHSRNNRITRPNNSNRGHRR